MYVQREGRGGLEPGRQAVIDQQPPDLLVGDLADQFLDVDAAVAQSVAVAIGLGDLGRERDDAF
jgi:hypothetical protein